MSAWLILVVIGQFLNAIVSLVDKFILTSKKVPKPILYSFFISLVAIFSISIFFLGYLPFTIQGLDFPTFSDINALNLEIFLLSILVGYGFLFAIFYTYSALEKADASDVVPVVGAISAIFTFILGYFILESRLTSGFFWGFSLLVLGTLFTSHFRFNLKIFKFAFLSGLFFSIHFFSSKFMFNHFDFETSFFWSRLGMGVAGLSLLFLPSFRKLFSKKEKKQKTKKRNILLVLSNATMGGVAGILIVKAIDLGDVSIIQALGGLQFVFIAIIGFVVGKITPKEFGENNSTKDIIQKTISIIIISAGFMLLFS
jgi:drug/metabolite transporter (DMT)-like permease